MNKAEISKLVTDGFRLDAEIKEREEQLKGIKEVLTAHANGNVIEIPGDGCKATINYSSRIASRVQDEQLEEVKELAGGSFKTLFCFAPIDKFRDVAKALLKDRADKLIGLLSGVPAARVSFKEVK